MMPALRIPDLARTSPAISLGLLWGVGGLVMLLSVPTSLHDGGSPGVLALIGAGSLAVGLVMLAAGDRLAGTGLHMTSALLGALTVSAAVASTGPHGTGAVAVLYVVLTAFAAVALSARLAVLAAVVSAALHAVVLVLTGSPGAAGEWVLIWGAAVATATVAGSAVATARQAARQQDALVDQLRDADAAKTVFLHAMGHELARPITVITGLAETVAERGDRLSEEQRIDLLQRIARRTRQMQETLDSLLRLRDVTAGPVEVDVQPVDLAEVIEDAIGRAGIDPSRVHVDGGGTIFADRPKLTHALANLLSNADKYTPPGSPVDIGVDMREQLVIITVEDRGPGIPDRLRWRIFEPFERAHPDHVSQGSGLGLSIVRQFARMHGGDAWSEPREGGGTRMFISVSCLHRLASDPAPDDAPAPVGDG